LQGVPEVPSPPKAEPEKILTIPEGERYLGHNVSPEGVTTDPEKLKAAWGWTLLRDKQESRSFLGLCTYYRRFIAGFADIAESFTQLTLEKQTSQWLLVAQSDCWFLESLCMAPLLGYPQLSKKFIIDMDACNMGFGGVLFQIHDGQEHLEAYFIKTLSRAERNYCMTQSKVMTIVKTLKHFHEHLCGQKFHLRTNHSALTWHLISRT
jgi:hypothetical protein